MNKDLFLAISSLDSYNRGYGVCINGLTETGRLGNATIREFRVGNYGDSALISQMPLRCLIFVKETERK